MTGENVSGMMILTLFKNLRATYGINEDTMGGGRHEIHSITITSGYGKPLFFHRNMKVELIDELLPIGSSSTFNVKGGIEIEIMLYKDSSIKKIYLDEKSAINLDISITLCAQQVFIAINGSRETKGLEISRESTRIIQKKAEQCINDETKNKGCA